MSTIPAILNKDAEFRTVNNAEESEAVLVGERREALRNNDDISMSYCESGSARLEGGSIRGMSRTLQLKPNIKRETDG